jgi:hypothetical protein
MINPFLLSTKDRLNHWKTFRKSLASLPEPEQLHQVSEYWSKTPLQVIAYNIDDPASWLSPWEMMTANDWCRNTIAIGMEFTLRLSGWDASRLALKMIIDRQNSVMILVLVVDDALVLNYDYGTMCEKPSTLVTLKSFKWDGKKQYIIAD